MIRKISTLSLTLALAILLAGCGVAKMINPSQPLVVNTPLPSTGKLAITSTQVFTDAFGLYHVVGSVSNGTSGALTAIELKVTIKDAAGNSLLKDDSGAPVPNRVFTTMLATLAAGESAPFDFTYDTRKGTPAAYSLDLAGYQSGKVDRASLKVENPQIADDQKGTLYLSGKLTNTSSQWVKINSVAGAVVGNAEAPLAAGSSFIFTSMLAPAGDPEERDRTPFVVSFPSPGAGMVDWRIYWDADVAQAPGDHPANIAFTNSYFDQDGAYHIVGYLMNNGRSVINPLLVAGLYAEDGTVLDAAYSFYTVAVNPGKNMPFDLSYFGSVNSNRTQAGRVRTFSVQADPARTKVAAGQSVDLAATGEQVQKNGAIWTFSGSVTNTTGKDLSGVSVIVLINDVEHNLVATSSTYLLPTSSNFGPEGVVPYQVVVALDPTLDSSNFRTVTTVIGYLK